MASKKPAKEMAVHNWLKTQMTKRYGINVVHIKAPAGIYSSRRGISDFVYCVFGCYVAIEVKSDIGKITLIQQNFLDDVTAAGGLGLCLYGKDITIFDKIEAHITNKLNK